MNLLVSTGETSNESLKSYCVLTIKKNKLFFVSFVVVNVDVDAFFSLSFAIC